jgi:fimbrial chaperone protein
MRSARGALRKALALALFAVASQATAASFGLAPIGITIAAREQSGSVVVTNTGTDEVVIQVRPYTWTQNGQESRTDTRELVLNPPIFKLAAGEQQLVRVASRAEPPKDVERAYRLVFSEVPAAAQSAQDPGFRIRVAMDIPLYVEPAAPSSAQPAWRFEQSAEGARLIVTNSGGRHFRLRDVHVHQGTQAIHTIPRIVVLAKSTLAIDLPEAAKKAQALRLIGQDDADQPVSIDISAVRAQ